MKSQIDNRQSYQSDFATVWKNRNNKDAPESEMQASQVADQLLEFQKERYHKKYPFERSQYHQCIPNPSQKEGAKDEFITVQIVNRQITLADEDRDRDEFSGGNILKRERFNLAPPVEEESEYNSDDYASEEEKDTEENKEEIAAEVAKGDKLYTTTALVEEVDAIVGIKSVEYAKCELVTDQVDKEESEVAIIGFWNLKDNGVFRCVHSFVVPNPMKREVDDV